MNLETQSFNLSFVKNEYKHPSENVNPYGLIHLLERARDNGSRTNVNRVSKCQDRIWGDSKMNSPNKNQENASGSVSPAQKPNRAGDSAPIVSQPSTWSQFQSSPAVRPPLDDNWLASENLEERFVSVLSRIGDREEYAPDEYAREWLNSRLGRASNVIEPILWHIHRMDPPQFVLNTPEFPRDKTLFDLLRVFRHPYLIYRKKTICIFVDSSQLEILVNKLNSRNIEACVLDENRPSNFQESNAIFLTTHPRFVGNLPLDNVINYQMFRTVNHYLDRSRLIRRRGYMTTFFNPQTDSHFVPGLVQEFRRRRIDIPSFLRAICESGTELPCS